MAMGPRKFGQKKSANAVPSSRIAQAVAPQAAPTSDRIAQAVSSKHATPRALRGTAYREASVVFESGYSLRCIVLDYSKTGVRLRFPTNEVLPPRVIVKAGAVGVSGPARVVWQHNSEVGLELL
ncbi:hypothetical protein [Hyphomonas chukchiensis]|nr:hypothetical protein [Hyphomonas chukchiensis]